MSQNFMKEILAIFFIIIKCVDYKNICKFQNIFPKCVMLPRTFNEIIYLINYFH